MMKFKVVSEIAPMKPKIKVISSTFSAVIITSSRNVTETRKKVQLSDIFMGSISGLPSE